MKRKGSNQYKDKIGLSHATKRSVFILSFIMAFGVIFIMSVERQVEQMRANIISPLAISPVVAQEQLPVEIETEEQEQIVAYIKEVFGQHADKAFYLLSCENSRLDPEVINVNTDSRQSKDVGIFQINEYWQRTQAKFLANWKINIEIAHQLYKENGNQFNLWTCGKKLGI